MKRYFEVGFEDNFVVSVNMIEGDEITSELVARHKAKKYKYNLCYIIPIPERKAKENWDKGMPLIHAGEYIKRNNIEYDLGY